MPVYEERQRQKFVQFARFGVVPAHSNILKNKLPSEIG